MGDTERRMKAGMSRRAFIGASAVAALTLATTGCSPENKLGETEVGGKKVYRLDAELDESVDGKWQTVSCNNNCGGKCLNKAYIVDGIVLRQKTDDAEADSWDIPQFRACSRGRARRQEVFGSNRIKYPMKRKNWEPLTGGNKELRGIDEWERISWDEACELIAAEIKNAIATYGNRSILLGGNTAFYSEIVRVFASIGGAASYTSTESFGSSCFNASVMGLPPMAYGEENDRFDYVNASTIVIYGGNPAWASPGTYTYYFDQAKKAGTEFVFVGPEYNATASYLNARWITVRPGTDTAFLLAVTYEMFKADEADPGSVIDWDFLAKYTVGIDGESMPGDAKVNENFRDYVFGNYDNIPKTAEWASAICGAPVEDIKWYANLMRKDNAVTTLRSYAPARCNDSDNFDSLYMTVGFMGGHIGKKGHQTGTAYHSLLGACKDMLVLAGSDQMPALSSGSEIESGDDLMPTTANTVDDIIPDPDVWQAVLDGKYTLNGQILGGQLAPGEERDIDIHVICHIDAAGITTSLNVAQAVEAHRKVDFVFATASTFTSQAQYSDIVLPVASEWERVGSLGANREILIVATSVVDPMFEAKSPQDILMGLADALGLDSKALFPLSEKQRFFNTIQGAQVKTIDNTGYENLVGITQENIDSWGVEGQPQDGRIAFTEFLAKGIYKIERYKDGSYTYYQYQDFLNDPAANPRDTPSGKFEIYCQSKADMLNAAGRTKDYIWKPYPTYKAPVNGYESSFADFESGTKGEYPYQITTPHYLRRAHTQFDNLPWLRQAFAQPLFINASDAAEKGIKTGDVVRAWSKNGQIIRPASVSERVMPGCALIPHGAWASIDPETGIDKAGCDNSLTGSETSGSVVSGYNTTLVNYEKYDGVLEVDYLWLPRESAIDLI